MNSNRPPEAKKEKNLPKNVMAGISVRSRLTFVSEQTETKEVFLEKAACYARGGIGLVKRGVTVDGKQYAVKIFGRGTEKAVNSTKEHIAMQVDQHLRYAERAITANALLQREAFSLTRGHKVYLLMPWIEGSTLSNINHVMDWRFLRLTFAMRYKIAISLLQQVQLLHAKNYLHGDIKPFNVMFDAKGNSYLIDLDCVRQPGTEGMYPLSPDFLDNNSFPLLKREGGFDSVNKSANLKSDVYALGITLLMMFPEFGTTRVPSIYHSDDIYTPWGHLEKRVFKETLQPPTGLVKEADRLRTSVTLMLDEKPDGRPDVARVLQWQDNVAIPAEEAKQVNESPATIDWVALMQKAGLIAKIGQAGEQQKLSNEPVVPTPQNKGITFQR